ncbi:hypothetical protein BSG1_20370 [Bacillus sp. SG-1]|nr:hypothetical protein BSG1_20370 [Bacillus sp. SG-1]
MQSLLSFFLACIIIFDLLWPLSFLFVTIIEKGGFVFTK